MSRNLSDAKRRRLTKAVKARDAGPDGNPLCGGASSYGCKEAVDDAVPYRDRMGFTLDHVNGDKTDHRLENLSAMHRGCNSSKNRLFRDGQPRYSLKDADGHIPTARRPRSDGSSVHARAHAHFSGEATNERREESLRINTGIKNYGKEHLRDGPMFLDEFVSEAMHEVVARERTVKDHLRALASGHENAPFFVYERDGEKYIALKSDPQVQA